MARKKRNVRSGNSIVLALVFVVAALGLGAAIYFVFIDGTFFASSNANSNTNSTLLGSVGSYPTVEAQLQAQSSMGQFTSLDELRIFLDDHRGMGSSYSMKDMMAVEESAPAPISATAGQATATNDSSSSRSDYSTTNIQVEGVDEADVVKTDGQYVYAVVGTNVFIVDAEPANEARIVSTIAMDVSPQNLYIKGDHLVVYGYENQIAERPFYDLIRPSSSYTFFKVFDVKDRTNPTQIKDLDFEGSFVDSRMLGDYVYLVTSQPTYLVYDDYSLPMVVEDDALLPIEGATGLCNCPDMYYIDLPYENYEFTTVAAINIEDVEQEISSDVYLMSAQELYMSEENLYLAYTKYISEQQLELEVLREAVQSRLSEDDKSKITIIESAPAYVLTKTEKQAKIQQIVTSYVASLSQDAQTAIEAEVEARLTAKYDDVSKELEKTVVHKISVDEGTLAYQGSGEVTGHVLNQFSMDERDGNLRIATTKNRDWVGFDSSASIDSYNNVYVLDKDLQTIGKVENLAKGEQIYSARFMGDRAYIVTFKQIDPLFVIDLSSPEDPKVAGELKVPGFSSYLHPYDENTLIGFGKQADENGSVKGLKLSLFDVTDPANLREIDTYEMGDSGSSSIALDDHKAFLFSKDKGLLVVPVTLQETGPTDDYYGSTWTHGAMVFSITKDGFTFRERIDHSDGTADDQKADYYYGYNYYDTEVKRSLYIDDELFTMSNKYLKINSLGDLSGTASVTFTPSASGDDYTIIR